MKKTGIIFHKLMKPICAVLTVSIVLTSLYLWERREPVNVMASQDTLPGVVQIRDEIIETKEPYRILEITPREQRGEFGFYVGGQEPFPCLWDEEKGSFVPWTERLAALGSSQERSDFMSKLGEESAMVTQALQGTGEAFFGFEPYTEVTADTEDARYVEKEPRIARGYFALSADGTGDWNAVFKRVLNQNIPLDEVNNGKDTPYYKASYGLPLTAGELEAMAGNQESATESLYTLAGGVYMEYAGTAAEAWELEKANGAVSGGDGASVLSGEVSGGNPVSVVPGADSVSGGDPLRETVYYRVTFRLINGEPDNQAQAGDQVYTLDARRTAYVEENGGYVLVETAQGVKAGELLEVPGAKIYFTGGLTNTEAFRSMGLGLDAEEWQEAPVLVDVCTPELVNAMTGEQLGAYDMIYIGNGSLWNRIESPGHAYGVDTGRDLSLDTVERLAVIIEKQKLPVIVDLSLLVDEAGAGKTEPLTYIDRFAGFLLSEDRLSFFEDDSRTKLNNRIQWMGIRDFLYAGSGESYIAPHMGHQLSFVNENVWFFHGQISPVVKRSGLTAVKYDEEKTAGGFAQVLFELQTENMYRDTDISFSEEKLPEEVSDAAVLRYLINYPRRRVVTQKSRLKVLEVEPAASVPRLTPETVAKWTGVSAENIAIDTMPVTKFIGLIEDLNGVYDLIYIGSSTEGLNVSGGKTVYNDDNMNGLVYSHTGDLIEENSSLSGLLDTDYTVRGDDPAGQVVTITTMHRYSGNDITPERYNDLLDYLDAYYPIVLSSELVTEKEGKRRVNEELVDNSSYLFELLDGALKEENRSIFSEQELESSALFSFCINKPKMGLADFAMLDTTSYAHNNEVYQIVRGEDGKYYMRYQFRITNDGAASPNAEYSCRLYIDINADGKFSAQTELLNAVSVTADGREADASHLKAGVMYTVSRQVPENYAGCITWNLEVLQNGNDMVRTSRQGYVRLLSDRAAELKVLQIYFNNNSINLEKSIGKWNGSQYNFTDGDKVTKYFHDLAVQIQSEYIFDITTVSRSEYEAQISAGTLDLSAFDMLIIGFSDANNGQNDADDWDREGVLRIREFIESGRSVLFAHDASSPINLPSMNIKKVNGYPFYNFNGFNEWYWGYNMNRYIRNMVGMDAFGVTMSFSEGGEAYAGLNSGLGLTASDSLFGSLSPVKDGNGRYIYGKKDLAYTPKSLRASTVGQVQGYAYQILNSRARMDSAFNRYAYRQGMTLKNGSLTTPTKTAKRVNEGQITNYPYAISDTIAVGDTHSQYYTLDMNSDSDGDNQTDLVVWYCLDGENVYGRSQGDVRNNYYIYSKGNIMYTGMGHHANKDIPNAVSLEEARLFINTIVASYQTGNRAPEVAVREDMVYRFTDPLISAEEEPVAISYRIADLNMTAGSKSVEVAYCVEDAAGTEDAQLGGGVKVTALTGLRTLDSKGREVTDLADMDPDEQYTVVVPAAYFTDTFKNGSRVRFFIKAQTTMTMTGITGAQIKPKQTPWGYGVFTYINCELFDLD